MVFIDYRERTTWWARLRPRVAVCERDFCNFETASVFIKTMADVIHQATEGAAVGPHRVVRWSPKDHAKFNRASRDIVRTLMLISRRISSYGRGGRISEASHVGGAGDPLVVATVGLASGSTTMHLPALPDEVWQLVISFQCVVLGARPVEILAGTGVSNQYLPRVTLFFVARS